MGTWDNCSTNNNEYSTWQVMEEYLPRELHEQYRRIFNSYDLDGTGVIHIEDVAEVAGKYGEVCSVENIRRLLDELIGCKECYSTNEDYLDFPEFLGIMTRISVNCISEDKMFQIFQRFDQDGDGFIGIGELRNLFYKLGEELTETELQEMIQTADKDRDGLVSYKEFVRLITNSTDNCPECLAKENMVKVKKSTDSYSSWFSECSFQSDTLSTSSNEYDDAVFYDSDFTPTISSHKTRKPVQKSLSLLNSIPWFKKSKLRSQNSSITMRVNEDNHPSKKSEVLYSKEHRNSYPAIPLEVSKLIYYSRKKTLSSPLRLVTNKIATKKRKLLKSSSIKCDWN